MDTETNIENIKNKALANKNVDDNTKIIEKYKQDIIDIQNVINEDDEDIKKLDTDFLATKDTIINEEYDNVKPNEKTSHIAKLLEQVFIKYSIEKAKLNMVGKATVFFDKSQGSFVELARVKKEDVFLKEKKEERTLEYRDDKTIKKMINKEAKKLINNIISAKHINIIMEWLDPYTKVFAPLKNKMYGDFYNVYTPNGFVELKVNNYIELDNFINNIMPTKYPVINALFCNLAPKDEERKYLVNWLSYILNTSNKTRNAIAFIGIPGSGKNVLQSLIIEYAVHPDNSFTVSNDDLKSLFNGFIEHRTWLFFNEIKTSFRESSTQADKIKPMITDSSISLNDKYMKQRRMDNLANCMFFSNHDLPFQIEEKDRRYSVIRTENKTLKDVAKDKLNYSIDKFISSLKTERDHFIIEMKMLKLTKESEDLALGLLDNETKNKIKEQTNTVRDVLKEKILDADIGYFDSILSDVIDGIENEKLKDKDVDKVTTDENDFEIVVKKPIIFQFTNEQYKNYLLDEVKQGIFSNETLRWFTKIYEIESANNLHKFGRFWNLVINKSELFTLHNQNDTKKIKIRMLDLSSVALESIIIHGENYVIKNGTNKVLIASNIPF